MDWEEKMAARARARAAQREAAAEAEREEEYRRWDEEHSATVQQYVDRLASDLRARGEEVGVSPACACIGSPPDLPSGAPCFCALRDMARERLRQVNST